MIKPSSLAMSCLLLPLVAGCLPPIEGGATQGDDDTTTDDPPGTKARVLFDRDVYPVIDKKCGNAGCHAETETRNGPFVDDVATEGYDRAVGQPKLVGGFTTQAPILTKIGNGHNNVTYSTGELGKIQKWLVKEVEERGTTVDLIAEWSGCLDLSSFVATGMAPAFGDGYTDGGYCKTCHALGEYDHIASDQPAPFFNTLSTKRTYIGQYFTLDASKTKVVVNEDNLRTVAYGLPPHSTHPRFDYENDPEMVVLRDFYDLTATRLAQKLCTSPRF
jgi:hypothetical protein